MATQRRQRSRPGELFARSTKSMIAIDENHCLVQMTHEIDPTELQAVERWFSTPHSDLVVDSDARVTLSAGHSPEVVAELAEEIFRTVVAKVAPGDGVRTARKSSRRSG